MSEATPDPSTHLEPPSNISQKEDPGAEDTASSSDDEHFSDASEGHDNVSSNPQSGITSPVPRTRVERVDSNLQHGEVPGTAAFDMRVQDAVPDEIEVLPESAEGTKSKGVSPVGSQDRPLTPDDSPIPRTVVEKVDPESPSHGEVPGTEAYEKRRADAVPDEIAALPESAEGTQSNNLSPTGSQDRPLTPDDSPIPRTVVEKVDLESPSHGEVPGTEAYEKRRADAVPDEISALTDNTEGTQSNNDSSTGSQARPLTPNGSPIPQTVVEKVDLESLSHGEVPGTEAYEKRQADAVPDLIKSVDDPDATQPPSNDYEFPDVNTWDQEIPETKVSRVDTMPTEEELPSHPKAHQSSRSDAEPDIVETVPDASSQEDSLSQVTAEGFDEDQEAGDDFDEFVEEQEDMGDDDFGDFDDGFQEPTDEIDEEASMGSTITPQQPPALPSVPPLVNFDAFKSTSELLTALQGTLNDLLPASQDLESLAPVEPIPDSSAIFSTERSLSLWSQLVAPPPLQPQNWVKSRIRRLFLVSLGVPVDLDEILPASKQKKLILPSIDLDGVSPIRNQARKEGEGESTQNTTTTGQAPTRTKTTRRGAPPPPELDLSAVRRLCATTDAALGGLTDIELKEHVQELENVTLRASSLLEYWLKRRDGLVGEKEAFEGVIENLVSHVRRVRK